MAKRRVIALLLLMVAVGAPIGWPQLETPQIATLTCNLGFLRVTYPSGREVKTAFRGSLSFGIGQELYPDYARLLLADLGVTIEGFPVFLDSSGGGLPERLPLDDVSISDAEVRWAHGGIHLATGEFFLYLHVLAYDLTSQNRWALEPQYIRLVLHGSLQAGATSISVEGTGGIPAGALAGTTLELRARCTVDWLDPVSLCN